jgi:F-type H+-transporting ATPase subunit b
LKKRLNLLSLGDSIKSRKETILKNLQDADNKFKEAEENLSFAKKNFESAKLKAEQIRNQGNLLSLQTTKALLEAVEEDIKRLKISNLAIIKLEEEKSINEICQKLNQFAMNEAIEKINKRINSSIQKKIISQNIEKLSNKILLQN